jgi:hypothetical protein
VKIAPNLADIKITDFKAEPISGPAPTLFKEVLENFISSQKVISAAIPKLPSQFKGLVELQRSCSALQLQVECVSRVAESITSSIKKVQQLGGQG